MVYIKKDEMGLTRSTMWEYKWIYSFGWKTAGEGIT